MRTRAKAINFGIIYGMGPQRLSRETGLSFAEAQAFIQRYFEVFAGVKEYLDRTLESAREHGYVTTLLGRRRYIPEIFSDDRRVQANAQNMAVNTPIQGTAADLIKRAMNRRHETIDGFSNRESQEHSDGCSFSDQLPLLLVDETHSDQYDKLETHLATCSVCQTAFEALTQTDTWDKWETLLAPRKIRQMSPQLKTPNIEGYQIESEIARGGMGVVYRARQQSLDRWVALKTFLPGSIAAPNRFSRFELEAHATAKLRHTGVVQVYDVGLEDGVPFLTMELVEGSSLRDSNREWTPKQAARLIESLARTIDYVHEQGIVHRDLTPGNILLDESQSDDEALPRITDFGLAKLLIDDSNTRTGELLGTPHYISPENARGNPKWSSPASDIYSLGVVLYELLTKRLPFQNETTAGIIQEIIHRDPCPPRQLNSQIPKDLETICLKCLEKKPSDRYETAGELAADLVRFRQNRPLMARRVSLLEKTKRWCMRHRAVSLLLTTLFLVATVALTIIVIQQRRTDRAISQKRAAEKQAETMQEQVDLGLYVRDISEANHGLISNDRYGFLRAKIRCDVPSKSWEWTLLESLGERVSYEWTNMHASVKSVITGSTWIATLDEIGNLEIRSIEEPSRSKRISISAKPKFMHASKQDGWLVVGTENAVHFLSTTDFVNGNYENLAIRAIEFLRPIGVTFSDDLQFAYLVSSDGKIEKVQTNDLSVVSEEMLEKTIVAISLDATGDALNLLTNDFHSLRVDIDSLQELSSVYTRNPSKPLVLIDRAWVNEKEQQLGIVRQNENRLFVININSQQESGKIVAHKGRIVDVSFVPNKSDVVASCDQEGFVRITNSRPDAKRVYLGRISSDNNDATAVCWLDQDRLAVGCRSGAVRIFHLNPNEHVRLENTVTAANPSGHTDKIRGMALHPKDDVYVTCGDDGRIVVHSLRTGEVTRQFDRQPFRVRGLAFVEDGQTLAAACNDGIVRFFDFTSGQLVHQEKLFSVNCSELAGTSDGKFLAIGGGEIRNFGNIAMCVIPVCFDWHKSLALFIEILKFYFFNICRYLFSFIHKDRQCESLVEKLCHRFRATT